MNLNAEKGELLSLHNVYNKCLKAKLKDWLKDGKASHEAEWCVAEKSEYLQFMRKH